MTGEVTATRMVLGEEEIVVPLVREMAKEDLKTTEDREVEIEKEDFRGEVTGMGLEMVEEVTWVALGEDK